MRALSGELRMTKTMIAAVLCGGLIVGACQSTGPGTAIGAVGGAAAGGLIGSQFGSGSGQVAATAVGTLLGAVIGSQLGAQFDSQDQAALEAANQSAFTSGQPQAWQSPSGGYGTVTPTSPAFAGTNGPAMPQLHADGPRKTVGRSTIPASRARTPTASG